MSGTTTKLTAAIEEYFADLRRVRASGAATPERSLYGPLGDLLKAVGATLKPKVFCVQEPADLGAGHPDFGLFAAKQVQKGAPREGQTPEHGVVEVKSPADDAWLTAAGRQAGRYWERYRLVLVTNARDFVLVGEDPHGKPTNLETLRLAGSEDEFLSRLEKPHAFARDAGARLGEYLARALSHRAAPKEPRDLAWLLASYARDRFARVEAASCGAPQLAAVRSALEEALGIRFKGERGQRFFCSTLVQTLFYGIFSAWVLWARTAEATPEFGRLFTGVPDTARFDWRVAVWHLRAPVLRALFQQIADPGRLQPLSLTEVLDWTAAALDRVDRTTFLARFNQGEAVPYFYEPFLEAFDPDLRKKEAGDVPEAVEVDVKRVATPRPCSVIGQGWIQQGGEPPMAKHDRRKTSGQPRSSQPVTIQVPLPVLGVINGVREAFHGLCIATGLQVLEAMMEVDRDALCGPKGRHQVERPAWRGGSVDSQVTLGGRQVEVPRLRVRSADGEVPLASFQWAASTDPLDEHTLAAVAAGVSTRRYASTLDPVPAEVNERATSSSAVSRRFVALSTKRLQAFLVRPLGELDLRVVCIDGKVFRDHCMVIALGIDTQGRKHVLGLREGATETAAVTTGLLSDLVTRGLPTDRALLFVVDGAAGLRRAITDVFGSRGVVQRCQVHKCRNVLGHLPERLHASVSKALRDAWNLDSADRAARVLERLAGSLERDHPGAAASIRERLEETLTVQRLGLTGALQRTLRTTNIIENLNGSVERYTRNVKRWRGGQMIQRWVASALVEAEPRFRRVRGYRDLQYLVSALDALAPPDDVVAEVA